MLMMESSSSQRPMETHREQKKTKSLILFLSVNVFFFLSIFSLFDKCVIYLCGKVEASYILTIIRKTHNMYERALLLFLCLRFQHIL